MWNDLPISKAVSEQFWGDGVSPPTVEAQEQATGSSWCLPVSMILTYTNVHIPLEDRAGGTWLALPGLGLIASTPSNKRHLGALIVGEVRYPIRQPIQMGAVTNLKLLP